MVTWKKNEIFGILFFVCLLPSSLNYSSRCPEMAELELYLKKKCSNRQEYHCLAIGGIEFNKTKEECRTPEWVSKGNYPVFRGRYIDYETCPSDSYQPVLFRSNERYKCTDLKSKCSLEGQVQVGEGTNTSDRTCRCDYNRGFSFINRPRNQCACIPSQEDCSCYIKRCKKGQKLNPDYQCSTTARLGNSNCVFLTLTDKADENPTYPYVTSKNIFNHPISQGGLLEERFIYVITALLAVTLIFGVMAIFCVTLCKREQCFKKPTENRYTVPSAISSKRLEKPSSRSAQDSFQINRITKEQNANMTGGSPEASDILSKSATSAEKLDIIILHSDEDNSNVEGYMGHLRNLAQISGYYDISIKSFKNVFQSTNNICLQEIINRCNFLFCFISRNNSIASVLKLNGSNEYDIHNGHMYPSIKTVRGSDRSTLDSLKFDFDYCNYSTEAVKIPYTKAFKEILKIIKSKQ